MTEGQLYGCQNPDRHRKVRVNIASIKPNSNPRCSCGSEMNKPYIQIGLLMPNSDIEVLASSKSKRMVCNVAVGSQYRPCPRRERARAV